MEEAIKNLLKEIEDASLEAHSEAEENPYRCSGCKIGITSYMEEHFYFELESGCPYDREAPGVELRRKGYKGVIESWHYDEVDPFAALQYILQEMVEITQETEA